VSNLRPRSSSANDNPKPAQVRNPVDTLRLNHLKNHKLKMEREVKTLKSALRHKEKALASSQGMVHALQLALQEESKLVKKLQEKNEKTKRKYKKIKYAIVNETPATMPNGITTLRSLGVPEWQEDLDLWGKVKGHSSASCTENSAATQSNSVRAKARTQQTSGGPCPPPRSVYFHSQSKDGDRSQKEASGRVNPGFNDSTHCQKKDQTHTRRSRDQGSCPKPSPFTIFRPTQPQHVDRSTLSAHTNTNTQTSPLNLSQNKVPETHINWSKLADCPNTVIPVKYADDKVAANASLFSSPSSTQPRCTFSGQAPRSTFSCQAPRSTFSCQAPRSTFSDRPPTGHSAELFPRSLFPCTDPSLVPHNYHASLSDPELAQLSTYPRNAAAVYNNLSDRNIAYCLPDRATGFRNNYAQNANTAPLGSPSDLRFNPNSPYSLAGQLSLSSQYSQTHDCEDNLGLDNLWGSPMHDSLFGNQNQQSGQQRTRGLGNCMTGCHDNDANCQGNNTLNNSPAAYGSFIHRFGFSNSTFSSRPFKASGAFNKLN